jgi:hypothetical protein
MYGNGLFMAGVTGRNFGSSGSFQGDRRGLLRHNGYRRFTQPSTRLLSENAVLYARWFLVPCLLALLISATLAESSPRLLAPNIQGITERDLKADVFFLASPEMQGRETLRREADVTAAYVRTRLARAGAQPAGDDGGWYQSVQLAHREWIEKPRISFTRGDEGIELEYEKHFIATDGAGVNATFTDAQLVFAGYAVNDPEKDYNDLAGLDLNGKLALIMRYEPSPWRVGGRRNPFSRHANLRTKTALLREAGAAGVLMVTGPESLGGSDDRNDLPSPEAAEKSPPLYIPGTQRQRGSLPFFHISLQAADMLLGGEGRLQQVQQAFDRADFTARPDFSELRLTLTATSREIVRECNNVAGRIDGEIDEWIILGAHHDHLGAGYFASRARERMGEIHPGADDNASGVATILAIAEALGQSGVKPRRGFLFLTFTGEEKGLLGSRWYVRNPLIPHEKVVAMINIDMIGRIRDNRISLTGTSSSRAIDRICREVAPLFPGLECGFSDRPPIPASDHWPFYSEAGIPVVFPFNGSNAEMHTPDDVPETINYADMTKAVRMIYEICWRISQEQQAPDYRGPVRNSAGPNGRTRDGSQGSSEQQEE